jgi:hypothetical protein
MGGVGKTTACMVVASDEEVGRTYSDAVLWMSLGIDVTAYTVVQQLANIVEQTGGPLTAGIMRDLFKEHGKEQLHAIGIKARDWLHGHQVLLVEDNVFPASNVPTPRSWVQFLKKVLGCDSCLLISTRALAVIAESDVQITFEPLVTMLQQTELLFAHLGRSGAVLDPTQIDSFLKFCCGLPIALATAAAFV